MSNRPFYSVICVTNDQSVLNEWTRHSLDNQTFRDFELVIIDNSKNKYNSAATALNAGASEAIGKYYIFAHHDLLLPDDFLQNMKEELVTCEKFGIAGVAGVRETGKGQAEGVNLIEHGKERRVWERGNKIFTSTKVETVDELLMVIPDHIFKDHKFDPDICSGWHLYGVEYSLRMQREGYGVYVLPLNLWHLSDGGWRFWQHDLTLLSIIREYPDVKYIHTTANSWPATRRFALYRASVSMARLTKKRVFSVLKPHE